MVLDGELEDEVLLGVVKLLGQGCRDCIELAVLARLNALVRLPLAIPLARRELEFGGGVVGFLPSAVRPSLVPGGCERRGARS